MGKADHIKIVEGDFTKNQKLVIYNNRMSAARAKLQRFKRELGISFDGLKLKTVVKLYSEHIGKPIPPGQSTNHWLYNLYQSGEDGLVKRTTDEIFYLSPPWLKLRKEVLFMHGGKCMKCGSTDCIHVDHIKPRSLYPELELDMDNMQVLCRRCNCSKSNRNITDYRPKNAA